LFAVVEQPYVSITSLTDLERLKHFMGINGFENTRNNDYINPEPGIILEDLHDENVLTRNNLFYFIDTVFYLTPDFYTSRFIKVIFEWLLDFCLLTVLAVSSPHQSIYLCGAYRCIVRRSNPQRSNP